MKKLMKSLVVVLVLTLTITSCKDDDNDIKLTPLKSVSYSPNKIDAKVSTAFASAIIKYTPSTARAYYVITKITKDGKSFKNVKDGFNFDSKGKIYGKSKHKLTEGVYVLTVTATDKSKKTNKKTIIYTVTVKK